MNAIIKRINELRASNGWNKSELASKAGVSSNTVSNWYAKDTIPSLNIVRRLCDSAGIAFERFFFGMNFPESEDKDEPLFVKEWEALSVAGRTAVSAVMDAFLEARELS